ncbi:MAG: hypothetical protein ACPGPS_00710 [Rubripirellula sp.]
MHELGVQQRLAVIPEITSLAHDRELEVCGSKPPVIRVSRYAKRPSPRIMTWWMKSFQEKTILMTMCPDSSDRRQPCST